jgi:hypothetical protein
MCSHQPKAMPSPKSCHGILVALAIVTVGCSSPHDMRSGSGPCPATGGENPSANSAETNIGHDDANVILDCCFTLSHYYEGQMKIITIAVKSGLENRLPPRRVFPDGMAERRLARLKTLDTVFRKLAERFPLESSYNRKDSRAFAKFQAIVGAEEAVLMRSLAPLAKTVWVNDDQSLENGTVLPASELRRLLEEEVRDAEEDYGRCEKYMFLMETFN